MKKIALTLAATLAFGTAAMADPVKVGIAAEPYPPFSSLEASGTWIGWEIDMINAVCTAAEMECVLTPTAWDGIIPALAAGQIDAIFASMSITEERKQSIDFSDPYYNVPASIVGAKGVEMTPDAAGLAGKIIGVQASTIHEAYVQEYFGSSAAEVKIYQTQDEAWQDLVAGRIDATQADSISNDTFLTSEAGAACCESKGNVADDPKYFGVGAGVGIRKGDEELKAKFNAGIAKVMADGTYDEITVKHFGSPIFAHK